MAEPEVRDTQMTDDSGASNPLPDALVGYFHVKPREKRKLQFPFDKSSNMLSIRLNEEFYVGRAEDCKWVFEEITCSNYHFRIYSIMFERSLPPLIYCEDLSTNGTFLNGQKIGKHNRALLSEGDKLEIRHSAFFKFHSVRCSEYNPPNLHHLEEDSMLFSSRFVITDRVLGQGGYGTIHMARNLTSKELKQVACKVLRFDSIKSRFTKQALFKEVEILMSLNHPNIINLMEVYSNSKRIYVFEELITGGDLWSYVQAKDRLAETDALPIMWQVVEALIYLHGEGIAHRDLKPENILLASTHPGRTRVVLADFGTARMVNGDKRMTTFVGTIEYTAPEVTMCQNSYTLSGYDMAADIWSLGNILYMILRGYPLFAPNGAADRKKVEALAAACDLGRLNSHEWKGASPEVKDLLRKLIVADPKYRLAAPAVKQHRWFSRYYDVLIEGYEMVCSNWTKRTEEVMWLDVHETPTHKEITRHMGSKVVDVEVIEKETPHVTDEGRGGDELQSGMEKCVIDCEDDDGTQDPNSMERMEFNVGDEEEDHDMDVHLSESQDLDMDKNGSKRGESFDFDNPPSGSNINTIQGYIDLVSSSDDDNDRKNKDNDELHDTVSRKKPGWRSAKEFQKNVLDLEERRRRNNKNSTEEDFEEDEVVVSSTHPASKESSRAVLSGNAVNGGYDSWSESSYPVGKHDANSGKVRGESSKPMNMKGFI